MTVTIWHLEILDRAAFRRSESALRYRLERVLAPSPSFLRYLYVATGNDWSWTDRLPWTDAQWLARQGLVLAMQGNRAISAGRGPAGQAIETHADRISRMFLNGLGG